jgi:hypothetical protein
MCQKKIWVSRDVLVPFIGMWGQQTKREVDAQFKFFLQIFLIATFYVCMFSNI